VKSNANAGAIAASRVNAFNSDHLVHRRRKVHGDLRSQKPDLLNRFNLICLSRPRGKNISVFFRRKSAAYGSYPVPVKGALAIVTNVGTGSGGRGSVVAHGGAGRGLRIS
jgi:hypothetical protein